MSVLYLNVQGQGYYNKMFREEKRRCHRRIVAAFTQSCTFFFFLVMFKSLSYINSPAVTDRATHLHFKPGRHNQLHRSVQLCIPATNWVYMRERLSPSGVGMGDRE